MSKKPRWNMYEEHKPLRMPFSFIPNCTRIITILSPPCCGVANAGND